MLVSTARSTGLSLASLANSKHELFDLLTRVANLRLLSFECVALNYELRHFLRENIDSEGLLSLLLRARLHYLLSSIDLGLSEVQQVSRSQSLAEVSGCEEFLFVSNLRGESKDEQREVV